MQKSHSVEVLDFCFIIPNNQNFSNLLLEIIDNEILISVKLISLCRKIETTGHPLNTTNRKDLCTKTIIRLIGTIGTAERNYTYPTESIED